MSKAKKVPRTVTFKGQTEMRTYLEQSRVTQQEREDLIPLLLRYAGRTLQSQGVAHMIGQSVIQACRSQSTSQGQLFSKMCFYVELLVTDTVMRDEVKTLLRKVCTDY